VSSLSGGSVEWRTELRGAGPVFVVGDDEAQQ
jgi:hypothetical protein